MLGSGHSCTVQHRWAGGHASRTFSTVIPFCAACPSMTSVLMAPAACAGTCHRHAYLRVCHAWRTRTPRMPTHGCGLNWMLVMQESSQQASSWWQQPHQAARSSRARLQCMHSSLVRFSTPLQGALCIASSCSHIISSDMRPLSHSSRSGGAEEPVSQLPRTFWSEL
jgi:hypothetical protein